LKKNISIEVKVTDRCNLDCFHCVNNDGPDHGIDIDGSLFTKKLAQWVDNRERSSYKVKEVRMTGGEPLLNLDAVTEIARTCNCLGIQSGINTNATLLDASTARLLKEAGLGIVKASFDSIDEMTLRQIRGPKASLSGILTGIQNAIEYGFRVILRLTLCSYNRDQLVTCYRMAQDLGVEKLQIKPLIRSGRAVDSKEFLSQDELYRTFSELAGAVNGPIAQPEILCWPSKEAAGLANNVCNSLNKIYVSTGYEAYICNYLPLIGAIGNLTQDPLERIFQQRQIRITQDANGHAILASCPQLKTKGQVSTLHI
jgi:cyclic pyranopterin phosphate synthase